MEEMASGDPDEFDPAMLEVMMGWDTRPVFYFNLFDHKHPEFGCQHWPASASLAKEILGLITAEDPSGNPMYPEMTSHDRSIQLWLDNTGTGTDRYSLQVAMVQEGDYMKIQRVCLPAEVKAIDLFSFIKAPNYAYTEAAIVSVNREDMPKERGERSFADVYGPPKLGAKGWSQYLTIQAAQPVASAPPQPAVEAAVQKSPAAQAKDARQAVAPAAAAPTSGAALLANFRNRKAAAPSPTPETVVDDRTALLDVANELPHCCGYYDESKSEVHSGRWVGEASLACKVCQAAEMCKEFTDVQTGLEEPAATAAGEATQQELPGFPEAESKAVRQSAAVKKGAAAVKKGGAAKTETASILQRLRDKKAAEKK
jgi:hypothetical protein